MSVLKLAPLPTNAERLTLLSLLSTAQHRARHLGFRLLLGVDCGRYDLPYGPPRERSAVQHWMVGVRLLLLAACPIHTNFECLTSLFTLNSLTFPIGVFATATTQLGKQLDSGAFRIIGTILSGVVILNWLAVGTLTVVEGARGKL